MLLLLTLTLALATDARVVISTALAPQDLTISLINDCTRVLSWNIATDPSYPLRDYSEESHALLDVPRITGSLESYDITCRPPGFATYAEQVKAVNKAHGRPEDQTFDCHYRLFRGYPRLDECLFVPDEDLYWHPLPVVDMRTGFDINLVRNLGSTQQSPSAFIRNYHAAARPFTPRFELLNGDHQFELRFHHPPDDYHRSTLEARFTLYDLELPEGERAISQRKVVLPALQSMLRKNRGDAFMFVETFESLNRSARLQVEVDFMDSVKYERVSDRASASTVVQARPLPFEFESVLTTVNEVPVIKLNWTPVLNYPDAQTIGIELCYRIANSNLSFSCDYLDSYQFFWNYTTVALSQLDSIVIGYEHEVILAAINDYGKRNSSNSNSIKVGFEPTQVRDLTHVVVDYDHNTLVTVLITWDPPADSGTGERPIRNYSVGVTGGNDTTWYVSPVDYLEVEVEYMTNYTVEVISTNALEMVSQVTTIEMNIGELKEQLSAPVLQEVAHPRVNTIDVSWKHVPLAQGYVVEVIDNESSHAKQSYYYNVTVSNVSSTELLLQHQFVDVAAGFVHVTIAPVRFKIVGNLTMTESFYCIGTPETPKTVRAEFSGEPTSSIKIDMHVAWQEEVWPQHAELALKHVVALTGKEEQIASYTLKDKQSLTVSGMYNTVDFDFYVRARVHNDLAASAWTEWILVSEDKLTLSDVIDSANDSNPTAEEESLPTFGIVLIVVAFLLLLALTIVCYRRRRAAKFMAKLADQLEAPEPDLCPFESNPTRESKADDDGIVLDAVVLETADSYEIVL
ncbi:MAG: hypothetical protein MHM6MM_005286 [Cercozoa sp. M6MM]